MTIPARLIPKTLLAMLPATLAACVVEGYVAGQLHVSGSASSLSASGPETFTSGTFNTIQKSYDLIIGGTRYVGVAEVGPPDAQGVRDALIAPTAQSALSCHLRIDGDYGIAGSGECVLPSGQRIHIELSGPARFHVLDDSTAGQGRA